MPNVITNDPQTTPVIRIEGVRKNYTMGDNVVHALRGVDLMADRGGMSRSWARRARGKSTLA